MGVLMQNDSFVGGIDSSLVNKIGTTTLTTTAQNLSDAVNELDTDRNKVTQTASDSSTSFHEILFSDTADNTTRAEGARKSSYLTYSPSYANLIMVGDNRGGYVGIKDTGVTVSESDNGLGDSSAIHSSTIACASDSTGLGYSTWYTSTYGAGLINGTLQITNYNVDDSSYVSNSIMLSLDKHGHSSYTISAPDAFCTAIGAVKKSGDTMTGQLDIRGTAASKPLKTRGIVGSNGSGSDGELHLQYGNSTDDSILFGNSGGGTITSNGTLYSGWSGGLQVPRVAKSCNYLPGINKMELQEFNSGTNYNLPSNAWYHIYTSEGTDANYACQLALGMTTNAAYYRRYSGGAWQSWTSLVNTDTNTTYSIATGDSNGQIKVTPSSGSAYNVSVKGLGSAAYVNADTSATANTVAKRQGNGYLYAVYFNTSCGAENPASYTSYPAFIDSNGWLRKSSAANFRSNIGAQAALSTASGSLSVTYDSTNATTNNDMWYAKYGNVVQLCGSVKNKNAITIPSHGDMGDLVMFTLPTGYRPKITTAGVADNGNLVAWKITSDGAVRLTGVYRSTGTYAAGTVFFIRATFIV